VVAARFDLPALRPRLALNHADGAVDPESSATAYRPEGPTSGEVLVGAGTSLCESTTQPKSGDELIHTLHDQVFPVGIERAAVPVEVRSWFRRH